MEQTNLFDFIYEKFSITKPIRLIELFAGYGSQALALKYLGVDYEHWHICEWATKSIQAYNDIHIKDYTDYSKPLKQEELIQKLADFGISMNYNEPMSIDQIRRKDEEWQRQTYNNIIATRNLVNIAQAKGSDLGIKETDKYEYILTYSFPCVTNDSLILTNKGYIEMKDVKVGDLVLTKSNTWQKVAKKFDNGIHQTCYLNAMGFENIHCTLNHKFYVREMYREWNNEFKTYVRKFKKPIFKETKDLTRKDYLGVPVIKEEKDFYTDDLDFWYIIGMYLGDGWLSKKGNDVIIACNKEKLELLKKHLKIHYTYNWNGTCYHLRFANKEIKNFIETYIGTGSENKKIPYEILCLPKKQLNSLYEGYLDSDGCTIKNKQQFTSINRNLIYSISLIINKLFEMPTCIYKVKVSPTKQIEGRTVNQKDWYQLRFKKEKCKQDKAFYEDGYIWYPFDKIEMAEKEHVYNMEVENDHSYIIQGCISKNCQDLSLAGHTKGMAKGSGTRSGMLWEVERLLDECDELPQVLLMENVPQVIGQNNLKDFQDWQRKLETFGYSNYIKILNAKDFGIPQNRERCFMVSILGDFNYKMPKRMKLKYKLKNLLEKEVEDKFYLSSDKLEKIANWKAQQDPLKDIDKEKVISPCLTARGAGEEHSGMVLINEDVMRLPEATKKGYAEAREGDGVYINRPHQKRGVVQKGMIQTLKTSPEDVGVVVKVGNYSPSGHNAASIVDGDGIAPTVMENHGTITAIVEENTPKLIGGIGEMKSNGGTQFYQQDRVYDGEGIAMCHPANIPNGSYMYQLSDLRVRKLTPRECWRLMGVKDEDFDNVSKNQGQSSLYHLAGDSIVTTPLMAMFGELLGIDYKQKINELVEELKE